MAEYKPLSQTTFKFVQEQIFQTLGDISAPTAPALGKVKAIKGGELLYYQLAPFGEAISSSSNSLSVTSTSKRGTSSNSTHFSTIFDKICGVSKPAACVVDAKTYHGLKNAFFVAYGDYEYSTNGGTEMRLQEVVIPKLKVKAIKYVAGGGITTVEFDLDGKIISEVSDTYAYTSVVQAGTLGVQKASGDIILGIEIEYPKYDITVSNTKDGLQYSVDDGATYQDLPAGLVLEQVEHIVFKNTSSAAVNIGTTEAGTEIGTIAAGATFVAVPTADGTWYIS